MVLFCDAGVFSLTQPTNLGLYVALDPPTYKPPSRIRALVDSNYDLKEISPVVRNWDRFFMVNAASNRSKSPAWIEMVRCEEFYMNLWSVGEILRAYVSIFLPGV